MNSLLDPTALYLGDNGRCFCGRLDHADASAHFTGRDLSGHPVHRVTEADQREAKRMALTLACETCGVDAARTPEPQARYAVLRAQIELRLAELRQALDEHEATRANWVKPETLERVDAGLAKLAAELT